MGFNLSEWFQRRKFDTELERAQYTATRQHVVVNPYHAVAVKPARECCGAALELRGKRFLSAEAPPLPLKGCTAAACTCTYAHFDDRRSGIDRRRLTAHPRDERRRSRGRRLEDQWEPTRRA